MRSLPELRRAVVLAGSGVVAGALIFGGTWAYAQVAGTSLGGGTRVSTLPACAAGNNGQTVYYQTSAMASSGVVWRLRCNSDSASAYKWEFVGGAPLVGEVTAQQSTTSASWTDLATAGPSVSVPLAGDYDYRFRARVQNPGSSRVTFTGIAVNGTGPAFYAEDQGYIYDTVAGSHEYEQSYERRRSFAAGDVLKMIYSTSAATSYWATRRLIVTPVRVG